MSLQENKHILPTQFHYQNFLEMCTKQSKFLYTPTYDNIIKKTNAGRGNKKNDEKKKVMQNLVSISGFFQLLALELFSQPHPSNQQFLLVSR